MTFPGTLTSTARCCRSPSPSQLHNPKPLIFYLLQATAFACLCACVRDAQDPARPASAPAVESLSAAAAAAAAAAAICAHSLAVLAHDEAAMLVTAGLHALSRAFDHAPTSAGQPATQEWQYALAGWLSQLPCANMSGGGVMEGGQLLAAVKLAQGKCRKWLEKGGSNKASSSGSSGSSNGSSSSSSSSMGGSATACAAARCVDMTAMD